MNPDNKSVKIDVKDIHSNLEACVEDPAEHKEMKEEIDLSRDEAVLIEEPHIKAEHNLHILKAIV